MNHHQLLDAVAHMRHCTVVEKVGQCICFEVFDDLDNSFLLACAMEKNTHGQFIFTTFRDCHLRGFADIAFLMDNHSDLVARMSRDWLSGLTFVLNSKTDEKICEIK